MSTTLYSAELSIQPYDGPLGYPARIWNKLDGTINKTVAAYWRDNFDLQHILERAWLGCMASVQEHPDYENLKICHV